MRKTHPYGRPIDNTVVQIVRLDMRPVATGSPGHLFIAGSLGEGLVGRRELTAQRFGPDSVELFRRALFKTAISPTALPDGHPSVS